jgi:hypothetical protein
VEKMNEVNSLIHKFNNVMRTDHWGDDDIEMDLDEIMDD